ncbi:MAG: hypothetical protein HC822_18175 [Oscillochloris sp.]|nr:hypothetical protein [Oscillochloris sp.]
MQKINTLFGKRVIDCRSGNAVANVRDVVLDQDHRHIHTLVIGDGNWSGSERVVHWNDITGVGEFVVIDGMDQLIPVDEDAEVAELRASAEQITGKKVISTTGEQVGTVADLYFVADGTIAALEMKQGIFGSGPNLLRAEHVQAIGRDAIISDSAELLTHEQFAGPSLSPAGLEEPRADAEFGPEEHGDAMADLAEYDRKPMESEVGQTTDDTASDDVIAVEPDGRPYQP